jgi:hypothetical protein
MSSRMRQGQKQQAAAQQIGDSEPKSAALQML